MVLGLPDRAGVDQPSRRKEEHAEAEMGKNKTYWGTTRARLLWA